MRSLRDLDVLDCQASGATPALGALLEIGWTSGGGVSTRVVVPPPGHRVPAFVQKLLGWSPARLEGAVGPEEAWASLDAALPSRPAPTVIHYASFELPFLRDLHARFGAGEFPLEVRCLHAIARRLLPDLPRRNLRALAGFLGHSTELLRRSGGHVEASAFVWRALVPRLEAAGVGTWEELGRWLEAPAPKRPAKVVFPMATDKRRALPDAPGVYRFVRSNGDVLYVGKATSLKKRVASHFVRGKDKNERSMEMLTQALDVVVTPTATALEAALLETDEIKRLDPPYNVQLREGDRRAWFASADLGDAAASPDETHRLGPLPSARALAELAAIAALVGGAAPTERLRAGSVGAAPPFAPPPELFDEVWPAFVAAHRLRVGRRGTTWASIMKAARALHAIRATLAGPDEEDDGAALWDGERLRRHLDRSLLRGGHLVRRARWLTALADSAIAFREAGQGRERLLLIASAEIVAQGSIEPDAPLPAPARRPLRERRAAFDAVRYDRMRTLATELERVDGDGGVVRLRIGDVVLARERLRRQLRWA